jgi:hypothetical protein
MTAWAALLGGVATGAAQAGLLRRASRVGPGLTSLLVRLLLVGAVLLLAARAGHLAQGAVGWMAGFAASGLLLHRRAP